MSPKNQDQKPENQNQQRQGGAHKPGSQQQQQGGGQKKPGQQHGGDAGLG